MRRHIQCVLHLTEKEWCSFALVPHCVPQHQLLTNVAFLSAATLTCGQDMSVKGLLVVYQVRCAGLVRSVAWRFAGLDGSAVRHSLCLACIALLQSCPLFVRH